MKKTININFGETVRRLRKGKLLTQEELADYCKRNRSCISQLEREIGQPCLSTFIDIARALDMLPSELFRECEKGLKDKPNLLE